MKRGKKEIGYRVKILKLDSLPHELLVEILSRLPVRHLWSLRSVSRSWLNLITRNPSFAKLNFDRILKLKSNHLYPRILPLENKDDFYLAINYSSSDKAIRLNNLFGDLSQYYVGGTCDGMICLPHKNNNEVYILNPLTKDYIAIQCSPFPSNRFPGYIKFTTFSFGYDHCSNKYKLVRTCCESYYVKKEYHSEISVYTLSVNSTWRVIKEDVNVGLDSRPETIPLVNGVLHWLTKRTGSSLHDLIGAFDLKDEVFREVPPPSDLDFNDRDIKKDIMELGGLLSIFWRPYSADCEIWMMEEYGVINSWTKKFKIKHHLQIYTLGIALTGGISLIENLENLVLFNQETNSFINFRGFPFRRSCAYPFIASLISPRLITGACDAIAE
ncbi:hypothetical protein ACHQM5_013824 [Ranunculus cassubicifolius]